MLNINELAATLLTEARYLARDNGADEDAENFSLHVCCALDMEPADLIERYGWTIDGMDSLDADYIICARDMAMARAERGDIW